MRRYYLVTDAMELVPNPGDILIGKGIEYLLGSFERDRHEIPIFNYINIFNNDCIGWERCKRDADVVVICGTPQLTQGAITDRFKNTFYDNIREIKNCGIKVLNLWVGFCLQEQNYSILGAVEKLLSKHRYFIEENFSLYDMVISRDSVTNNTLEKSGIVSHQLVDSVTYAHYWYTIFSQPKVYNLFVLKAFSHQRNKRQVELFEEIEKKSSLPCFYLVHQYSDYIELCDMVDNLVCVSTCKSLLEVYSHASEVYSLKVHGSVVASKFGCSVLHIGIDSRSDILNYIGAKTITLNEFYDKKDMEPEPVSSRVLAEKDKRIFYDLYSRVE